MGKSHDLVSPLNLNPTTSQACQISTNQLRADEDEEADPQGMDSPSIINPFSNQASEMDDKRRDGPVGSGKRTRKAAKTPAQKFKERNEDCNTIIQKKVQDFDLRTHVATKAEIGERVKHLTSGGAHRGFQRESLRIEHESTVRRAERPLGAFSSSPALLKWMSCESAHRQRHRVYMPLRSRAFPFQYAGLEAISEAEAFMSKTTLAVSLLVTKFPNT